MTRKDYNEFVRHIEKTKGILKSALTPKPYKLCINKDYYNEMTEKQKVDFYDKNKNCIITFFGGFDTGIEVLHKDGSLTWFDGQIDEIHFVSDDMIMEAIYGLNTNPTDENAIYLKTLINKFSEDYKKEHGYTPTIHIDQYMSCLSTEAFTVYQSIK